MAWITQTEIDNAIGSTQSTALGLTTGSARLTQYELQARATVSAAAKRAGYGPWTATLPTSSNDEQLDAAFLQKMTLALMLRDAYALVPGIALTAQAQAAISQGLSMLDAFYEKTLPLPSASPNTLDGVGGVKFNTDQQAQVAATSPVFRSLRGSSF